MHVILGLPLGDGLALRFALQAQRELGLQVTPIQSTIVDMAVTLFQLGIATPKPRKEGIGAWLVSQLSWK